MNNSPNILPEYDFSDALTLSAQERLEVCLRTLRERFQDWQSKYPGDMRPLPASGASEEDLHELERGNGASLPPEYRTFLKQCRYLTFGDGFSVWGVSQGQEDGSSDCSSPWFEEDYPMGFSCWIMGDCWRYADGDQLVMPIEHPGQPVMLYLHEYGPLLEQFAPSFSLALWRMTHEEW